MRVLLARFSILSLCVLAVSVEPARGQSPSRMSVPSPADIGTNHFVANFIDTPNTGNAGIYEMIGNVRVDMTNSSDSMHVKFSDPGRGVASNKGFENTAAGYPSFDVASSGFNSPPAAGASQNPPAAGAGQAPPPAAGAGQTPPTATGSGPDQSVVANIGSHLKIFGAVKLDVIWNEARPQAPGVPFFLVPKFAGGFTNHTIDMNARQSLIGVLFTGPKVGNFQSGGRISAVFFDSSVLADTNGFLLQASYGELFNDKWRFAAGLQFDIFAPGLPTVLPFSYLGGSGSPGNCIRGQIRVERFVGVGSDSQLTLQGALSQPLNTYVTPDVILDEDNGWPNLEGRIAFGGGKAVPIGIGLLTQRPVEVGVSGLVGQLRRTAAPFEPPRRVVSDVWGAAVDFRVNLTTSIGFKGEVYSGQALGNYNGAVLQSLDAVTWNPIRATGGFVEGFVYLKPNLHSHTGYGMDDPNNNDMTAIPNTLFGRTYNSTLYSNLLWDLNKSFRIAFEATYRETKYKEPTNLPNYGVGFHTQFMWAF